MPTSKIVFVSKTADGWLQVILEGGKIVGLPYGLKVKQTEFKDPKDPKSKDGLEHIEILEGTYKGIKATAHRKPGTNSHFDPNITHGPGRTIRFDLKSQSLYFNNHGPYNAFSGGNFGKFTPISPGTYQLAIPAFATNQTRAQYSRWAIHHKSWFRIGLSVKGDRFLHCGEISEGCVTVRQFIYNPKEKAPSGFEDLSQWLQKFPGGIGFPLPDKPAPVISWDRIYDHLILSRLNDQSVGTLIVT